MNRVRKIKNIIEKIRIENQRIESDHMDLKGYNIIYIHTYNSLSNFNSDDFQEESPKKKKKRENTKFKLVTSVIPMGVNDIVDKITKERNQKKNNNSDKVQEITINDHGEIKENQELYIENNEEEEEDDEETGPIQSLVIRNPNSNPNQIISYGLQQQPNYDNNNNDSYHGSLNSTEKNLVLTILKDERIEFKERERERLDRENALVADATRNEVKVEFTDKTARLETKYEFAVLEAQKLKKKLDSVKKSTLSYKEEIAKLRQQLQQQQQQQIPNHHSSSLSSSMKTDTD